MLSSQSGSSEPASDAATTPGGGWDGVVGIGGIGGEGGDCGVPAAEVHITDGLTMHLNVASPQLQAELAQFVEETLRAGRAGAIGKSYNSPPMRWADARKSREMLQWGVFTNANRVEDVDVLPLPPILLSVVDLFERVGVVRDASERFDTCVANVYDTGNWIPPHVDSEKFERPFCTLSLLSAQRVCFGDSIAGAAGRWSGAAHRFEMPVGSVLRVDGVAAGPSCQHALYCATAPRISLTFRRLTREALVAVTEGRAARAAKRAAKHAAKRAAKLQKRAAKKAKKAEGLSLEKIAPVQ